MSESHFSIRTSRSGIETTLTLFGECDISNVADLDMAVSQALSLDSRCILLDLEGLRFMGVCGLTSIVKATASLDSVGGSLEIQGASQTVKWLVDFFGFANDPRVVLQRDLCGLRTSNRPSSPPNEQRVVTAAG